MVRQMTALAPDMTSTRRDLGRGFYSLGDLRAFLALSGRPGDASRALPWLTGVLNPVAHEPRRPDYSFSDLISLFVVRFLRSKGVEPKDIREAEQFLRERWKTDRPFVNEEIKTDGRNVFYRDELIAGQIEAADMRGQQTMREMVKDKLTRVHYRDGTAAYWVPRKHVILDPRVQFGEPVVEGTRVPTEAVAEAVGSFGVEGAAGRLDLSPRVIAAAVSFENKRAAVLA
jgi:uncharacterized protein (DUF433 family)/DNA-binding transcriptional MerR regulator